MEFIQSEKVLIKSIEENGAILIVGQTGSGKTNLINNLIASLVQMYSPEELGVAIIDMKAVEAVLYIQDCNYPHIVDVCATTDVSMGRSCLLDLKETIRLRKEINTNEFSRLVVIIDEFTQLDDFKLLEELIKEGPSVKVNFVLASQSVLEVNDLKFALNLKSKVVLKCSPDLSTTLLGDNKASSLDIGTAIYKTGDETGLLKFEYKPLEYYKTLRYELDKEYGYLIMGIRATKEYSRAFRNLKAIE